MNCTTYLDCPSPQNMICSSQLVCTCRHDVITTTGPECQDLTMLSSVQVGFDGVCQALTLGGMVLGAALIVSSLMRRRLRYKLEVSLNILATFSMLVLTVFFQIRVYLATSRCVQFDNATRSEAAGRDVCYDNGLWFTLLLPIIIMVNMATLLVILWSRLVALSVRSTLTRESVVIAIAIIFTAVSLMLMLFVTPMTGNTVVISGFVFWWAACVSLWYVISYANVRHLLKSLSTHMPEGNVLISERFTLEVTSSFVVFGMWLSMSGLAAVSTSQARLKSTAIDSNTTIGMTCSVVGTMVATMAMMGFSFVHSPIGMWLRYYMRQCWTSLSTLKNRHYRNTPNIQPVRDLSSAEDRAVMVAHLAEQKRMNDLQKKSSGSQHEIVSPPRSIGRHAVAVVVSTLHLSSEEHGNSSGRQLLQPPVAAAAPHSVWTPVGSVIGSNGGSGRSKAPEVKL